MIIPNGLNIAAQFSAAGCHLDGTPAALVCPHVVVDSLGARDVYLTAYDKQRIEGLARVTGALRSEKFVFNIGRRFDTNYNIASVPAGAPVPMGISFEDEWESDALLVDLRNGATRGFLRFVRPGDDTVLLSAELPAPPPSMGNSDPRMSTTSSFRRTSQVRLMF